MGWGVSQAWETEGGGQEFQETDVETLETAQASAGAGSSGKSAKAHRGKNAFFSGLWSDSAQKLEKLYRAEPEGTTGWTSTEIRPQVWRVWGSYVS